MTPEQLKKHRERMGLTQEQLGKALGRSERFITYRESGVREVCPMLAGAVRWLLHSRRSKK